MLVLTFNGWIFEGYEDARTALMSTILDEVASKTTLTSKGRRLVVKLLSRINYMRVLAGGAKVGLAYGLAGPLGVAVAEGPNLIAKAKQILEKNSEITKEELAGFLKDDPGQEARRDIREFRKEFEELINDTELDSLVIIIDDLDRCMPDTIIETLEAIKLFLYAHKTVFLLGADERLVKYAVRRRFPELPGEKVEVGRDYLEKLVQFPVRIPPLGRPEIETYLNLLFAKNGGLDQSQFEEARTRAIACNAANLLDVRFNHGVAAEILRGPVPPKLAEDLILSQHIAPILANTSGFPRQCKRFLNSLMMRLAMAKSRSIELKPRALAKLMLLEYFRPQAFKKLAELQAEEQGKPSELAKAERVVRPKSVASPANSADASTSNSLTLAKLPSKGPEPKTAEASDLSSELPTWLADSWTREWLQSEPILSEVDLRPYFYFSRDTLGQIGIAMARLSPLSQSILTELFDMSETVRNLALKKAADLKSDEAISVFQALIERVRQDDDSLDDRSALKRCFDWIEKRPELFSQLLILLETIPLNAIPGYAIPNLITAIKTAEDKNLAIRILEKWSSQNENIRIQGIAQSRLRSLTT